MLLIKNGRVLNPATNTDASMEVLLDGERIAEVAAPGKLSAAARGGFTAICCMPNTKPVNDNASVTRFIMDRAKAGASVRVWPIGAASVGSKGEAIAEIAAMKQAGIVAV